MMLWVRRFMNRPFDNWFARWTGFSWNQILDAISRGGRVRPALVLMTKGARTGETRKCVLPYFHDGSDFVVIGSNGGAPKNPAWIGNLQNDPNVAVYVKGRLRHAVARVAQNGERERLFSKACEQDRIYTEYQGRTDRKIPTVALTPV